VSTVTPLAPARELRDARAELKKLLHERAGREVVSEKGADLALRQAAAILQRHGFLLAHEGAPLLDFVEWMMLSDRLRGNATDYMSAIALATGDHRHIDLGGRLAQRQQQLIEIMAQDLGREVKV
jgi:hypothetical protein